MSTEDEQAIKRAILDALREFFGYNNQQIASTDAQGKHYTPIPNVPKIF